MKKQISITGMSCEHCAAHVKEALETVGGKNVKVNLKKNTAVGEFDDSINDESIKKAVQDAGYDVSKVEKAKGFFL